ncbi:MAG: peptidoglycan DD-metalloendopeptidase family protein [Alphaproteobacteria bacterium]|nr:peptidoglycan DD-metalloendopeptidase family protein [Alphaproteobacteria bacterium]MDY4689364.1 peptidoglycan DD-metalloendopeptidase family protein [Alphaproteobacteria bacterium]
MPGFTNLRKKVRRRRIETILLAGYAVAVTCALFVSMLNKNSEPEAEQKYADDSYDFSNDVMTPAYNDVKDNPFEVLYAQVNSIKLLSDDNAIAVKYRLNQNGQPAVVMPIQPKPKMFEQAGSFDGIYQKERRVIIVSPGDNFIGILTNLGMENKSATNAYNTLKKVYDARNLKVGQHIELTATFDVQSKSLEALDTLVIEPVRGTKYILQINEYDQFEARVEQEKFAYEIKDIKGTVAGNVSASLNKAGVPYKLCGKVTQMFAHLIDFKRDVKKGDTFNVKYEVNKASDGEVVSVGDVIFASFTVNGRTHKLYRYKPRGGTADYYDEKGGAKKTGLDKKPMAMRNARISSLFGYRRHPIYKTTKFHSGVDYAAPRGTAIYASGAGTIEMARYVNGYGNFIKIRHNSEYETAYGHMQKFAAGMRPGVRVKKGQIIGYVGSTGRSTGPHLHFEILRKGQRIDPLKAKVATGNDLTGNQLAEFKRIVKKVDNIKASELVSTEKKKEAAEAKKEAAAENAALKQKETVSESAKTAAGTAENKTSEAKAAEKQANENKTAENKAAAPKTAVTIPQKEDLLASSVKPESRESAANNTVQSNKKPVYPAKTPARKKQNTKVTNANSLKVVRSISRKPKK